ncbi:MAG: hypothetical protein J7K87_01465 [Candidatus Aenigmarchaeota archaeon]|nr:hypothetical protein [Candidatus Aenigmarchaeota archaeon]
MVDATKTGTAGLWTSIVGAIIILIDGIAVLATNHLYIWSAVNVVATGWIEIILSIIMLIAAPFYKKSTNGIGWTLIILAIITLGFDGGFFWIGAIITIIGGALILKGK